MKDKLYCVVGSKIVFKLDLAYSIYNLEINLVSWLQVFFYGITNLIVFLASNNKISNSVYLFYSLRDFHISVS